MKQVRTEAPPAWLGPLTVLTGGVMIGLAPIGLRLGLDDLGPQAIAFWRYVFAVPLLFGLVLLTKKRLPARPNGPIIIAGVCFTIDIALWHAALTHTSVANATFIVNLGNLGVGLTAWAILKQRPSPVWALAALMAMSGAAALSFGGGENEASNLHGDLLALGGAVMISLYMVFSKMARGRISGIEAIFWLTVTEMLVAALIVLIVAESFLPMRIEGFIVPLFLALAVQIGGQALIILGLGHTPAAIAGVLVVVQPVVAATIAWRLFGEPLTSLQILGGGLILSGIILSQRPRKGVAEKSAQNTAEDTNLPPPV